MSFQLIVVLLILITAVVLFVTEKVRVDVTALGVVVALMLSGVLTTSEALAGFSNSAVVTIAALFVIGGGVLQTGLAEQIGRTILHVAGKGERRLPLVIMLAAALMSGIMSDTGTVAVLLPVVVILARQTRIALSKLLLPLAFGSLLGGAMTLIGTPPNIIVNDVLRQNGYESFQFFSFTPLGATLLLLSIGVIALFGDYLLPDRKEQPEDGATIDVTRVIDTYHLRDEMSRLRVRLDSPLVGKRVAEANLRQEYDIDLLKIMRPEQPRPDFRLIGPARNGRAPKSVPILADSDTVLQLDDVLVVMGDAQKIGQAAVRHNLAEQPSKPKDFKALIGREVGIAELLIPRNSKLVGKTLTELRFRARYQLNVLSIYRPNQGQFDDVRHIKLQFGDILIVHGPWEHLLALKGSRDFIVMGQPEAMAHVRPTRKTVWVGLILLAMIVGMIAEWLPLTQIALLAAGGVVLSQAISMDDAYQAINWKSLILIAGMIPMSTALTKVGLVNIIADGLVESLGRAGPMAMLAGLFILTAVFTQFLSNTATVVVLAPIALTAAARLNVSPQAFMMGIAVAGSMAFASPVASPVNTLILGPGGYQFRDYLKAGVPLIIMALFVSLLLLPLLFPF